MTQNPIAEPLLAFRRDRTSFDTAIKTSAFAMDALRRRLDAGSSAPDLRNEFGWESITAKTALRAWDQSADIMARLWLVHVMSIFESFVVSVVAELTRWDAVRSVSSHPTGPQNDDDGAISLNRLYERNGWPRQFVDSHLPLFRYMWLCRNCIAHRGGIASPGLAAVEISDEYFEALPRVKGRRPRLPNLPEQVEGAPIQIGPREIIVAAVLCNRLAEDITQNLCLQLDVRGMVYHTAFHAVLTPGAAIMDASYLRCGHSANEAINVVMKSRYYVLGQEDVFVSSTLRELGVWNEVHRRYSQLVAAAKPLVPTTKSSRRRM